VADVDVAETPGGELRVTLSVSHGTLTLGGTAGLTFEAGSDGTDDPTMTFRGTPAALDAALNGLVYAPGLNYYGPETLSFFTNDLGNTGAPGAQVASATVDITVRPVNDAPVVTLYGGASSPEGGYLNFTFTTADVDSTTFTLDHRTCGSNATLSLGTFTASTGAGSFRCTFIDGNGSSTVQVRVTDGFLPSNTDQKVVAVSNVAPTPSVVLNGSVDCQTSISLTPSFTDPGVNDGTWSLDINWGDGSHTTFTAASQGAQAPKSHIYALPNTYHVTLTVTDKDTGSATTSATAVTVNQVYTVKFLPPFDTSNPSNLITNTMKSGRTVPVKITIYDVCRGAYVTGATASAVTIGVSKANDVTGASTDAVETYADAGAANGNTNLFRWTGDGSTTGGGFWIYNLDSTSAYNGGAMGVGQVYRINAFVGSVKATQYQWALLKPVK
jgi:PKD domain/Bacterial Ig domain